MKLKLVDEGINIFDRLSLRMIEILEKLLQLIFDRELMMNFMMQLIDISIEGFDQLLMLL